MDPVDIQRGLIQSHREAYRNEMNPPISVLKELEMRRWEKEKESWGEDTREAICQFGFYDRQSTCFYISFFRDVCMCACMYVCMYVCVSVCGV